VTGRPCKPPLFIGDEQRQEIFENAVKMEKEPDSGLRVEHCRRTEMQNRNQHTQKKNHWISRLVQIVIAGLCLVFLAFMLSPAFFSPDRGSAREGAAAGTLRNFHSAQVSFKARKDRFGTLRELADDGVIDPRHAGGKPIKGYIYFDSDVTESTYCIHADRQPNDATRWYNFIWDDGPQRDFNITEEGEVSFIQSKTRGTVLRGEGTKFSMQEDSDERKP
jgi:hypothetical protein